MDHRNLTERLIDAASGTLSHAIACYIGAGLFAAYLMGTAIPALNWVGKAYIIATWPRVIRCAPVENQCDPLPPERMSQYIFNLDEVTK